MKILFVASEAKPFITTGGLGDVIGSLPKTLSRTGNDVRVILPKYKGIPEDFKDKMKELKYFYVNVGWRNQYCDIEEIKMNNVTYYFVDNEYYFKRDNLYGYYDDGERFAFFDRAVLDAIKELDWKPDVIHCNDWHCGMIPALYKLEYINDNFYLNIKIVYSIHNLLFQGIFPPEVLPDLFGYDFEQYHNGILKFNDGISFMKAGIYYADKVTTVSNTYAKEITTPFYGEKLDWILRERSNDLKGIVNGIDYEEYNPETDKLIVKNYNIKSIKNKKENKIALQKELNLVVNPDIPIIAVVSRLTHQKGIDLIINIADRLLQKDVQLIILGTGDKYYEEHLEHLKKRYFHKVSTNILFDSALSHKIYAGADIMLMPSTFEPCGLGQLIALRYGTIPVVRETGGLKDTVHPYNEYDNTGNGFSFRNYYPNELLGILDYALSIYNQKEKWGHLIKSAMESDNSWENSALEYIKLYDELIEK